MLGIRCQRCFSGRRRRVSVCAYEHLDWLRMCPCPSPSTRSPLPSPVVGVPHPFQRRHRPPPAELPSEAMDARLSLTLASEDAVLPSRESFGCWPYVRRGGLGVSRTGETTTCHPRGVCDSEPSFSQLESDSDESTSSESDLDSLSDSAISASSSLGVELVEGQEWIQGLLEFKD
jgi:hypothetical protein